MKFFFIKMLMVDIGFFVILIGRGSKRMGGFGRRSFFREGKEVY